MCVYIPIGLRRWLSGKESTYRYRKCRRHEFDSRVRKMPWRRKWQPTPVLLPENIPWTEEPVGIGMKTDIFQSCVHCWVFQICWHIECSILTASSFRIWNSSAGIPSHLLAFFLVMLPKQILKEMGIPDHLTCLLRNLYACQEATVRTGHGKAERFQVGKGVRQDCILSPCLFNLYAEYIMRNARLNEAQARIKIAGRKSITSDMQMTPPLWQKVKKNVRASWWKWKRTVKKLA